VTADTSVNRHVVISGASRGLGSALVRGFLDAGYKVSAFSRKSSDFVQGLGDNKNFYFAAADLSDASAMSAFVKSAEAALGPVYGLVNCAATAADGLLATTPDDSIRKVLAVNAEGTIRLTRLVVRRLLIGKSGGVVLNVSSISSIRGFRGLSVYAFTKGGLDAFTRALARELGSQGIRVNSIVPGYFETEMTRKITESQKEQILRRTPLGRLGDPEDVVGAALFFFSDAARFITGQCLVIDGGSTL
jgi:3-oxoacyl-[acyl-carrier protein] reductase